MRSRPRLVTGSFLSSRVLRTCRRSATPLGALVSLLLGRATDHMQVDRRLHHVGRVALCPPACYGASLREEGQPRI
jgi:hypothetical protein